MRNNKFINAAVFAATYRCPENNNDGFKVIINVGSNEECKQIKREIIGFITGIPAKDLSKPGIVESVKEQLKHYEDRETLQKNLRIMRSVEFENVIKTDADLPDYMCYYLPVLDANTMFAASHRGLKNMSVIADVVNVKDGDVEKFKCMFTFNVAKEKKNLETQQNAFESIKNDFK